MNWVFGDPPYRGNKYHGKNRKQEGLLKISIATKLLSVAPRDSSLYSYNVSGVDRKYYQASCGPLAPGRVEKIKNQLGSL